GVNAEAANVTGITYNASGTPYNASVTLTVTQPHVIGEPLVANLQGPAPWFTTLGTSMKPGDTTFTMHANGAAATNASVAYEGQVRSITQPSPSLPRGSWFRIGTGPDAEWFQVSSVATTPSPQPDQTTGTVTVAVTAAATKFHAAGSAVTDSVVGNPG